MAGVSQALERLTGSAWLRKQKAARSGLDFERVGPRGERFRIAIFP